MNKGDGCYKGWAEIDGLGYGIREEEKLERKNVHLEENFDESQRSTILLFRHDITSHIEIHSIKKHKPQHS